MTYEPLNRRLAILAAICAFLGVILGAIALGTNYWTIKPAVQTIQVGKLVVDHEYGYIWNGLFQMCKTGESCFAFFQPTTFIVGLLGILFLLVGGIFSALEVPKASDRRFITPLIIFIGCVLMTASLVDYGSHKLINSHSSRSMLAAVIFAYIALSLSAFVAGRYSTVEQVGNGVHLNTHKYAATSTNEH